VNDLALVAAGFAAGLFVAWWCYRVEPALGGDVPEGRGEDE
jgi:hypothetical protein